MTAGLSIEPLEWKFAPHPREPASGYASRLAALNGIDLASLLRASGIPVRQVHGGRPAGVRGVADLGGLDAAGRRVLAWNTPVRATKHTEARFRDEQFAWGSILSACFRFCPHCIHEDLVAAPKDVPLAARPWLRFEWLIAQVRSCRVHSVLLAETHPVTGTVPDFAQAMDAEVLPQLDALRAAAVPAEPNAFEDWLLGRLEEKRDQTNWLDAMPLHAAMATCEAIGVEGLGDGRAHMSELGNAAMSEASLAGYRVASGGRGDIDGFLDNLVARSHATGFVGIKTTYGYILEVLERTLDDPAFDPFRDVVRRHAMDNVPLPAGSQVLGQVLEERRLHTIQSAAEASGTSRPTLLAIFARSGISPARSGPDQKRLTVRADVFEARLREYAVALRVDDVVTEFAVRKKHLLELIARRHIPTLFNSREVLKARHRMARADVDAFMDRLFQGAVPVEKPTRRQVSLGRACLVASTNVGDLVGLILDGRIAWKGSLHGGRLYDDLLVDADEVTRVLQGDTPARVNLTKLEIAKEWPGLRRAVVEALIKAGELKAEMEFCPSTRRRLLLVTRESYDAFTGRYQTLTDICHSRNIDPRVMRRHLADAGCKPSFDADMVGNFIYERTPALDAALVNCPLRGEVWARSHPGAARRIRG